MPSILAIKAIVAALILAALTAAGWALERHIEGLGAAKQFTLDNAAAIKQKVAAARLLADLQIDADRATKALLDFKNTLEVDREKSQAKNIADLRARTAGPRLQFTTEGGGCRPSSPGPATATATAASDQSPTVVQLPEPLNGNLLQFAADAQSLAIDYGVLYAYVNDPKMACTLQK